MKTNMKKVVLIICAIAVALVGVYAAYDYHSKRTPEYSLLQIHQAIKSGDKNTFEYYVDVDNFIDKGYSDVMDYMIEKIIKMAGPDVPEARQDKFKQEIKLQRANNIEYLKDLYGKTLMASKNQGSDNDAFVFPRNKNLTRETANVVKNLLQSYEVKLGQISTVDKKATATVEAAATNEKVVPQKLTIELELMQQADGRWVVVRVANMDDILKQIYENN